MVDKFTEKELKIYSELIRMGITIQSTFIPYSKAKEMNYNKDSFMTLNWSVDLYKNGKKISTMEYHEGQGHCPANKTENKGYELRRMIEKECEEGFETRFGWSMNYVNINKKKPILPNMVSFIGAILLDSFAGRDTFEDFCGDFGYDEDSRSAEKIWNTCRETTMVFYRNFSTNEISKLEELYQDY